MRTRQQHLSKIRLAALCTTQASTEVLHHAAALFIGWPAEYSNPDTGHRVLCQGTGPQNMQAK